MKGHVALHIAFAMPFLTKQALPVQILSQKTAARLYAFN